MSYTESYLRALKHWARIKLALKTNVPVRVLPDTDAEPFVVGEGAHYITPHGARVHSPRAYRAAGGRCFYVSSTIEIRVGEHWKW